MQKDNSFEAYEAKLKQLLEELLVDPYETFDLEEKMAKNRDWCVRMIALYVADEFTLQNIIRFESDLQTIAMAEGVLQYIQK